MVDVDGVVVVHPDPKGWSANLERDLGLPTERLQEAFFKAHFDDVVHGRAALRERLGPVLAEIAPGLTCETLIAYWFEQDSHLDHALLAELAQVRGRGVEVHLATVQEHERANYLWKTLALDERLDAMHYAADLGCAKPAQAFFTEIERRTGLSGEQIAFIDDKSPNVVAARQVGWRAKVWTGQDRLSSLMPDLFE
jgi:putative hydrolase of the HAD superfamily